MKKKFFWIQQGLNQGPSGYGTCMLQKSYGDLLLYLDGDFYGTLQNSLYSEDFYITPQS